jgi:hypothetical protein
VNSVAIAAEFTQHSVFRPGAQPLPASPHALSMM